MNANIDIIGGRKYQKRGSRLEQNFLKVMLQITKGNIETNVMPKKINGDVIVEFDIIYKCSLTKRVFSFEIKGIKTSTINCHKRQQNIIDQCNRQKKYLSTQYSDYKVYSVLCLIDGELIKKTEKKMSSSDWTIVKKESSVISDFIKLVKQNDINVAIGTTPKECAFDVKRKLL
jgi:hypothetical protein